MEHMSFFTEVASVPEFDLEHRSSVACLIALEESASLSIVSLRASMICPVILAVWDFCRFSIRVAVACSLFVADFISFGNELTYLMMKARFATKSVVSADR
jgi:hypothetical protein